MINLQCLSWKFLLGFIPVLFFLVLTQNSHAAGFSCSNVTQISKTECQALVAIYNSTEGRSWNDKKDWLSTNTPCFWEHIACFRYGDMLKVYSLNLSSNSLSGELPDEIGDFSDLLYLRLQGNNLNGGIPKSVGNLKQLRRLHLDNNPLVGPIPAEVGSLSQLEHLTLNNTEMYGAMPSTLTNLSKLNTFEYAGTFICLGDNLGDWFTNILRTGTLEISYRQCNPLPKNEDSCDGRVMNLDQTFDAYSQIEDGDRVKWTHSLPSSEHAREMNVTVYFTCNKNGEEIILARKTRKWYCGEYAPSVNAGLGDKTADGYWGFRKDTANTLTCYAGNNGNVTIQDIVYQTLKDHLGFQSPEDAIPSEFTVGSGDYFDVGAQIIPVNGDCGSEVYQTIFHDKNTHFYIHDYRGRGQYQPYIRVYNGRSADILSIPLLTLPNKKESTVYVKYTPDSRNVYEEAYMGSLNTQLIMAPGAHNNKSLKISTQSTKISIGHVNGNNRFCGYIRNIIVDPFILIGGH